MADAVKEVLQWKADSESLKTCAADLKKAQNNATKLQEKINQAQSHDTELSQLKKEGVSANKTITTLKDDLCAVGKYAEQLTRAIKSTPDGKPVKFPGSSSIIKHCKDIVPGSIVADTNEEPGAANGGEENPTNTQTIGLAGEDGDAADSGSDDVVGDL